MNTKRLFIFTIVIVVVLLAGLSVVAAQQGRGGARGNDAPAAATPNGMGRGYGMPANAALAAPHGGNGYQGGSNPAFTRGMPADTGLHLNLPAATTTELPQEIVDLMLAGWQDEQHAYAVYGAIIAQFGAVRPFVNLQRSEAQHISAWETLLARYAVDVPAVPEFELPQFDNLAAACAAGVTAETVNRDLYATMLAAFAPYPDLLHVAQNLQSASEQNHLGAFERCAVR